MPNRYTQYLPYPLAIVVSAVWVAATRNWYAYNTPLLTVGESLLYPWISWSLGLTATYLIYRAFKKKTAYPLLWTAVVYVIAILALETIAYHIVGIQNLGTSHFEGLPICDCLHAPPWMQAAYLLFGPLFVTVSIAIGMLTVRSNR